MKSKIAYLIICEGDSEYAYVQELNRLLNERGCRAILTPCNAHGGGFASLRQICRRKKTQRNGRTFILADRDIYERNDNGNRDSYESECRFMPPFMFQYWNFEDFLLMHFDSSVLGAWREEAYQCGHKAIPKSAGEFEKIYELFCEQYNKVLKFALPYEKGDMPFSLKESHLRDLFANSEGDFPRSDFISFIRELFDK